jgi:hypothetical protein
MKKLLFTFCLLLFTLSPLNAQTIEGGIKKITLQDLELKVQKYNSDIPDYPDKRVLFMLDKIKNNIIIKETEKEIINSDIPNKYDLAILANLQKNTNIKDVQQKEIEWLYKYMNSESCNSMHKIYLISQNSKDRKKKYDNEWKQSRECKCGYTGTIGYGIACKECHPIKDFFANFYIITREPWER